MCFKKLEEDFTNQSVDKLTSDEFTLSSYDRNCFARWNLAVQL